MNQPNTGLTKICSSCGQRKPLSAFLQIGSSHGYGNICSSCRKTAFENPPQDAEESTRSTTGAKLDAKVKVKEVADKREAFKQTEEDYFKERDKKEHKKIERTEKIIHAADKAKKHRGFWEKSPAAPAAKNLGKSQVFGGADHIAAAGKVDFSHGGPIETTRVAGQVKTAHSSVYQSFKTWLGNAPIVSAAERAAKQKHLGKTAAPGAPKTSPDAVSEFTHQNTGPKSKR